jgi:hypothetical protein
VVAGANDLLAVPMKSHLADMGVLEVMLISSFFPRHDFTGR